MKRQPRANDFSLTFSYNPKPQQTKISYLAFKPASEDGYFDVEIGAIPNESDFGEPDVDWKYKLICQNEPPSCLDDSLLIDCDDELA